MDFIDEFSSGVPSFGLPDIEATFGVSHTEAALAVFSVPLAVALVAEPILLACARRSQFRYLWGGMLALGAAQASAAFAPNITVLAVCVACWFSLSGLVCSLAQCQVIDASPGQEERWMTRWTLSGTLGDLFTPLAFAGLSYAGLGWRAALGLSAVFCLVLGVALIAQSGRASAVRLPPFRRARGQKKFSRASLTRSVVELRALLVRPGLLPWMFATLLCSLMDEILVAFAAVRMAQQGLQPYTWSLVLGAFTGGAVLSLVVIDRLTRRLAAERLLGVCAFAAVVSYAGWMLAPSVGLTVVSMFAVGLSVAPLYPLAKARVYAVSPGSAMSVALLSSCFGPIDVLLPWLLGVVADRWGVAIALWLLLVQPLGVG